MRKQNSNRPHAADRRAFLKSTAVASAATSVPYFFSKSKTLADETVSKNDRPTIGVIGSGGMANGNMRAAKQWVDVVAIADVDTNRAEKSNQTMSAGKADTYNDYREILERDDVDLIHVATPDHWHTKPLIEAMLAGKDVYCEKPLTLTIDEGKLIRKIQKETGRIVQVGTQQRSTFPLFVKAMAIVADGRLGKDPSSTSRHRWRALMRFDSRRQMFPQGLIGTVGSDRLRKSTIDTRPAKDGKGRGNTNCHYEFRWWYEYSGGKLTDWGAHHVDICNWALKLNGQTEGPAFDRWQIRNTRSNSKNGFPVQNDRYNTATSFLFNVAYPGGTEMIIRNDDRQRRIDHRVKRVASFVSRKIVGRQTGRRSGKQSASRRCDLQGVQRIADGRERKEATLGQLPVLCERAERADLGRSYSHGNAERLPLGRHFRPARTRTEMGRRQRTNRRRRRSKLVPFAAVP